MEYKGILSRDNGGFILQASGRIYRLELQRVPIDALERHVIISGICEGDIITADGVRINDEFPKAAL